MTKCRTCSYKPRTAPRVFCPSCGAVWHKATESRDPAKSKLGEGTTKKKAPKKATKKAGAPRVKVEATAKKGEKR